MLDNLAKLHANGEYPYEKSHALISNLYDSHFAYDWYKDEHYGRLCILWPWSISKCFPYIVQNEGTHFIIGKAASAHNAWVVGALESAVRSVYQFLYKHSKHSAKCNHVLQEYNQDKVAKPYGPIPKEFDRTKDVKPLNAKTGKVVTGEGEEAVELVSGNGEWLRQGVQVEKWRLQQGGDRLIPEHVGEAQVNEFTVLTN